MLIILAICWYRSLNLSVRINNYLCNFIILSALEVCYSVYKTLISFSKNCESLIVYAVTWIMVIIVVTHHKISTVQLLVFILSLKHIYSSVAISLLWYWVSTISVNKYYQIYFLWVFVCYRRPKKKLISQ